MSRTYRINPRRLPIERDRRRVAGHMHVARGLLEALHEARRRGDLDGREAIAADLLDEALRQAERRVARGPLGAWREFDRLVFGSTLRRIEDAVGGLPDDDRYADARRALDRLVSVRAALAAEWPAHVRRADRGLAITPVWKLRFAAPEVPKGTTPPPQSRKAGGSLIDALRGVLRLAGASW